ncbi:MAG: hypothetical protein ACK5R0_21155 [Bacteroidota bacterium]
MTSRFLFIGVLFLTLISVGQNRYFIGVDVLRSFPSYFQKGFTFEPSFVLKNKSGYYFDLAFGITRISHSSVYSNINYHNEGEYLRFAVRKELGANFDIGLGFGFSRFTEYGNVDFSSPTYGNYKFEMIQENRLFFVEPTINYKINLSPRFQLIPQYRVPFVLGALDEDLFPVYSAPGIGDLDFLTPKSSRKSTNTTVAISLRLVYQLSKN